jgi:hypothetical protein
MYMRSLVYSSQPDHVNNQNDTINARQPRIRTTKSSFESLKDGTVKFCVTLKFSF